MAKDIKRLSLLFLLSKGSSGHLITSIITIMATSSATTPCTELDPVTNRMQWAQQCAMAPSNIVPLGILPATTTSTSNTGSSISSDKPSTRSSVSSIVTRSSTSARRSHNSTFTSATSNAATTASSASSVTGDHQNSSGINIGAIAGVISTMIVLVILAWILWRTRDKWLGYFKSSTGRYADADEKYVWDNRSFEIPATGQDPRMFRSESPQELDLSPTAPYDVRHLEAGRNGVTDYGYGRSYAVTNPDPPSASTATGRMRESSVLSAMQGEVGEDDDTASQPESDVMSPVTATASEGGTDGDGDLSPRASPPPMAPPQEYTPYRPGSVWSGASADPGASDRPQ